MNVLSDYLTRPLGLIFSYQFCDQQLVYNRSADFFAPTNVRRVSLLIYHASLSCELGPQLTGRKYTYCLQASHHHRRGIFTTPSPCTRRARVGSIQLEKPSKVRGW